MINQDPLVPVSRQPRALLKVNGEIIREIESLEYVENNYYMADSFHAKLPIYNRRDALDLDYFFSQPAIMVEILIGFPSNPDTYGVADLQSLIMGGIDQLDADVLSNSGCGYQIVGRDLSKLFIDNKIIYKYPNKTASEIATILANNRGLNPIVTKTDTNVGYYYNQDFVNLNDQRTEWDLLIYLAQQEGFIVFVRGKDLFFQPAPTVSQNPYILDAVTLERGQTANFNGSYLRVSRNLNYARDVVVTVRSHNAKTGHVEVTAKSTLDAKHALAGAAQPLGEAQKYQFTIPGLSKQQALMQAQKILANITQHERLLESRVPGDNLLRKDSVIQLKGVAPSIDQTYYPDTITRRIASTQQGYSMEIRAKNHSPLSVVLA
jgi:hypothetical protein